MWAVQLKIEDFLDRSLISKLQSEVSSQRSRKGDNPNGNDCLDMQARPQLRPPLVNEHLLRGFDAQSHLFRQVCDALQPRGSNSTHEDSLSFNRVETSPNRGEERII